MNCVITMVIVCIILELPLAVIVLKIMTPHTIKINGIMNIYSVKYSYIFSRWFAMTVLSGNFADSRLLSARARSNSSASCTHS